MFRGCGFKLSIWRMIIIAEMVFTRLNKGGSKKTSSPQTYKHMRSPNADDVLDELLEDFSESNKDSEILVPLCEKILKYENNLNGNSFVLVGPASSGKESHVLWLAKDIDDSDGMETHLITIDCRLYQTDYQFLNSLTRELRVFFCENLLSKHIVINETTLNLVGLNKQFEKLRRKLILVIKSAQLLASHRRKQRILYNIFEWLNNTDAKKYITILLLTRNITFFDKLEKRTRSRMNMPIIYLHKIKPKEVLEIIKRRIQYRIQNCTKKNAALLEKLLTAFEGNKELMKILEQQYEHSPRDITNYLKIMKLIITLDIQNLNTLETATQSQINTIIAEGFSHYSQYSADYKTIAKYLFINLSHPEILLLGFIRQRLMNQEGRNNTEITLKVLTHDYNTIRQRKSIFEGGTFCNYPAKLLGDSLQHLQQQNFITVAKIENMELQERTIISQYSPDDLMLFFRQYCECERDGVPPFIKEVYDQPIYHQ